MKKLISIVLVLLMLVIPLVSCKDPDTPGKIDDSDKPGGTDTALTDDSGSIETESDVLEIPEEKFDCEFNILSPGVETFCYAIHDFDEPSADAYENALYERNVAVEEMLGITINQFTGAFGGGVYDMFRTAVDANTGDFDLTFNMVQFGCTAMGAGYLYRLDDVEYLDLSKSWWNRDCTEQLSVGGVPYMACGDIALSDKESIWALYFIKDIIAVNGLESPYKLVFDNKWTWDKMSEMIQVATNDENGSGSLDPGDIYGFCTHVENYPAMWQSAGLKLITLNEDGIPEISWNTDRFVTVYEDIVAFMSDAEHVSPDDIPLISSNLKEGKTLFGTEVIAFVRAYRENEHDFGLLPLPKYDEDVDRYYSYMTVSSNVMTIGKDCDDPYKIGIIAEAMAAKGAEILIPAYYEGQLKSRYSRDEESSLMLDIIFENRSYDMGVFFNWGSAYTGLCNPNTNPTTLYAQTNKAISKQIEKSLEKLNIK